MYIKLIIAFFLPFMIELLIYPYYINFLKKLKIGQVVREEGPKNHLSKANTPTMGGLIISLIIIIFALILIQDRVFLSIIFLPFLFNLFSGFLDDYIISIKKQSLGLKARHKLLFQFLIFLAVIYLAKLWNINITSFYIPIIAKVITIKNPYILYPLMYIMFSGIINAVNLTDGQDGLAALISITAFSTLAVISYFKGYDNILIISVIVISALIGFLWFNIFPAQIFMGDTGSLALGSLLAICMFITKSAFLFPLFGFIFLIETLSVMIQVTYFKLTKGKRIFKMTPLHHHFELSNIHENHITFHFFIISIIFAYLAIVIYFYK